MTCTRAKIVNVLGVICIIGGVIVGILLGNTFKKLEVSSSILRAAEYSFNFGVFVSCVLGFLVSGILLICFAGLIEDAAACRSMLSGMYDNQVRNGASSYVAVAEPPKVTTLHTGERKCSACGEMYPAGRSSCPHCGGK